MKGPFFAERDILLSSDFLVAMLDTTNLLLARLGVALYCGTKNSNKLFTEKLLFYFVRRFTMNTSVRLLLRVLYPRVGWPQGVTG